MKRRADRLEPLHVPLFRQRPQRTQLVFLTRKCTGLVFIGNQNIHILTHHRLKILVIFFDDREAGQVEGDPCAGLMGGLHGIVKHIPIVDQITLDQHNRALIKIVGRHLVAHHFR